MVIKQLSVCDVPQLFESLASVVPIKLVRVAHCDVPRITAHRTYMGRCGLKNDWQFYNPRIDTDCHRLILLLYILLSTRQ